MASKVAAGARGASAARAHGLAPGRAPVPVPPPGSNRIARRSTRTRAASSGRSPETMPTFSHTRPLPCRVPAPCAIAADLRGLECATARQRSAVSPMRKRVKRTTSVGSGEKSLEQSGNGTAPADLTAGAHCTRPSTDAKLATKAPVYDAGARKGSSPMETESPEVVAEPVPPEGALTLVPPAEGAALLLNDPAALKAQLETYGEARRLLVEWLMSQLVAGIDYTLIHRKVGARGQKTDCPEKGNMTGRGCQVCGG